MVRCANTVLILVLILLWQGGCDASSEVCGNNGEMRDTNGECSVADEGVPDDDDDDDEKECGLYLAPSSIPNAGYGVYTVRSFQEHQVVHESDSISIVILGTADGLDESTLSDYTWEAANAPAWESEHAYEFWPGVGALLNHHSGLSNVQSHTGWGGRYEDSWLHRSKDAGVGAFSYYGGATVFATSSSIQPGQELFVDYGNDWVRSRADLAPTMPTAQDYESAEGILRLLEHQATQFHNVSSSVLELVQRVASSYNARLAGLLPSDSSALQSLRNLLVKHSKKSAFGRALARSSLLPRDVAWVKGNGQCLDHLVSGRSHLAQAGRGAFARRDLPKGSLIAPAPLLQIIQGDSLRRSSWGPNATRGTELLLNYCFGHEESTLLLCPATNVVLVNHCSTRHDATTTTTLSSSSSSSSCAKDGPNAFYRWSRDGDATTFEWLHLSWTELTERTQNGSRGLAFDFVAMRDIKKGEEIYMDYGLEWEEAWTKHVQGWVPFSRQNEGSTYQPLQQLTFDKSSPRGGYRALQPNGDNAMCACLYWDEKDDMTEEDDETMEDLSDRSFDHFMRQMEQAESIWQDLTSDSPVARERAHQLISRHRRKGGRYTATRENLDYDASYWPCRVGCQTTRTEECGHYLVQILQAPDRAPTKWSLQGEFLFLSRYPPSSISFFNKPYQSDQHLRGTFRHAIPIREDLFPPQWKNKQSDKRKKQTELEP